jgi:quinol monooxygenase YgiN
MAGMELSVFIRFHARPGQAQALAAALGEVVRPSRAEAGCVFIEAYRSVQDADLFHIHSRWVDEAAFDRHGGLPHTLRFLATVQPLLDHPLEVARTRPL